MSFDDELKNMFDFGPFFYHAAIIQKDEKVQILIKDANSITDLKAKLTKLDNQLSNEKIKVMIGAGVLCVKKCHVHFDDAREFADKKNLDAGFLIAPYSDEEYFVEADSNTLLNANLELLNIL